MFDDGQTSLPPTLVAQTMGSGCFKSIHLTVCVRNITARRLPTRHVVQFWLQLKSFKSKGYKSFFTWHPSFLMRSFCCQSKKNRIRTTFALNHIGIIKSNVYKAVLLQKFFEFQSIKTQVEDPFCSIFMEASVL